MRIRTQLLLAFVALTVAMLLLTGWLGEVSMREAVDDLSKANAKLSTEVMTQVGKSLVQLRSREAALEMALLLRDRQGLTYDQLRADPELRRLATRDIETVFGTAGYMDMLDDQGVSVLHPNQKIEGHSFQQWEAEYPRMWNLVRRSFSENEVQGYYDFMDDSGKAREKYMVLHRVPGTSFILAAVVNMDSFFLPLHKQIHQISTENLEEALLRSRALVASGFGAVLLAGLVLAVWFTRRISRPVDRLVDGVKAMGLGSFQSRVDVRGASDIRELADAFNHMGAELADYMERLRDETARREAAASEMKIARQIQDSLLPSTFPPFPERDEFSLFAANQPAKEVGGDLYDFFFIPDGRLALVLGDVSGKGVPAALFMTMTRTLLRNICNDTADPAAALDRTNELLCADNDACMFVTLFLAYYDTRGGELVYTCAGHNPPLLMNGGGIPVELKVWGDAALGVLRRQRHSRGSVHLEPGSLLLVYTDGITEAPDAAGEQYGVERVGRVLRTGDGQGLDEIGDTLLEQVERHQAGGRFDDETLLLLRREK